MRIRAAFPILIALTCLLPATPVLAQPAGPEPVMLRWKWEAGTELRYRMTTDTVADLPMGLGETRQSVSLTQRLEVERVEDGRATVAIVHERVRASVESPIQTAEWDSTDGSGPPDSPMLRPWSALASQTIRITFEPDGRVHAIEGLAAVRSAMLEGLDANDPVTQLLRPQLESMFSEEAMRQQWETATALVPGRETLPGEQWSRDARVPMAGAGAIRSRADYMLLGVGQVDGDRCARIRIGGELTAGRADGDERDDDDSETPAGPLGDVETTITDSAISGHAIFDIERGCVTRQSTTVSLAVTLRSEQLPAPLRQHVRTTTRTERIDDDGEDDF